MLDEGTLVVVRGGRRHGGVWKRGSGSLPGNVGRW